MFQGFFVALERVLRPVVLHKAQSFRDDLLQSRGEWCPDTP